MMTGDLYFENIRTNLLILKEEITTNNKLGYTDINKSVEDFFGEIFNILCGYKLTNLNKEQINYPGIDLGDINKSIAFQITAEKTSKKVEHTLQEFIENRHYDKFSALKIFILDDKQKSYTITANYSAYFVFDIDKDIIDYPYLLKVIRNISTEKKSELNSFIQNELPYGKAIKYSITEIDKKDIINLKEGFASWQKTLTDYFSIPGLNISLPINQAWCKVGLMLTDTTLNYKKNKENKLTEYYGKNNRSSDYPNKDFIEADILPEFNNHSIIIGGPGSGKSTLLKRIANYYSSKGKIVILLRLPIITAKMLKKNIGIEEAVCLYLADCSPFSPNDIKMLLKEQFIFLADGLDECGQHKAFIIKELKKWSALNGSTSIVITTRSIGYDSSFFEGWAHYEIANLNKDSISKFIWAISKYYYDMGQKKVAESFVEIEKTIENSNLYKTSTRNPLLLGFVLSLIINKAKSSTNRASLYKNIIQLVHNQQNEDRLVETSHDFSTLITILNITAFVMKDKDTFILNEIIEKASDIVADIYGTKKAGAKKDLAQVISYWAEKGILEKISDGPDEIILFIHMGFNEYCASQHIATLGISEINQFLDAHKSDATWRETIMLLGMSDGNNKIAEYLLSSFNPSDITSENLVISLTILANSVNAAPDLLKKATLLVLGKLTSDYPSECYEVAEAASELASSHPQFITEQYANLLRHEYAWTRKSAWTLILIAGEHFIDLDFLESQYDDLTETEIDGDQKLRDIRIIKATDILLKNRNNDNARAKVENLFLAGNYTFKISSDLYKIIKKYDFSDVIAKKFKAFNHLDIFHDLKQSLELSKNAHKAILNTIINATEKFANTNNSGVDPKRMMSLSALYETMDIMNLPVTEFYKIGTPLRTQYFDLAVSASIAAANIDKCSLYHEAKYALSYIIEKDADMLHAHIKKVYPRIDWGLAADIGYSSFQIIELLNDPCQVVSQVGLKIFARLTLPSDFSRLAESALTNANSHYLYFISQFASKIWGPDALLIILKYLADHDLGESRCLFSCIPELTNSVFGDGLSEIYLKAIGSQNIRVVESAVKSLLKFHNHKISAEDISKIIEYWKINEKPYPKEGGGIPDSPRPELLKLLSAKRSLSYGEIVQFLIDDRYDVFEVAKDILARQLLQDDALIVNVLEGLKNKTLPISVLPVIFENPQITHEMSRCILSYLYCDNPKLVVKIINNMSAGWPSPSEQTEILERFLKDENAEIRDAAFNKIKHLKQLNPRQ